MTTQPGDDTAAGKPGHGHLRASHADREHVISTLKAAFVQGMLTKDELDARVGQALASRTYAGLAAITADLPAWLAAAQPPKPARAGGGQPILRPSQIIVGATVLYAGFWWFVLLPGGDAASLLVLTSLFYLGVLAIAVAVALENRRDKRSGRQLTRGSGRGAGGQASQRPTPAGPDRQLPPAGHGHQHAAEAAPSRRSRTLLPCWRARIPMPCAR